MKPLDLTSTVVAGFVGAGLLALLVFLYAMNDDAAQPNYKLLAAAGFVVGAGVQTGVRLSGVS